MKWGKVSQFLSIPNLRVWLVTLERRIMVGKYIWSVLRNREPRYFPLYI